MSAGDAAATARADRSYSIFPLFPSLLSFPSFLSSLLFSSLLFPMDPNYVPSASDELEFTMLVNEIHMRETQRLFNSTTEKCFNQCVSSFRARNLDSSEKKCLEHCTEKFIGHTQRMGIRFQEEMAKMQEKKAQAAIKEGAKL